MHGLLFAATALSATLQVSGASLVGTVHDDVGDRPIAGALVTVVDPVRMAITDDQGRYVLLDVPPGPHHVRVRAVGYAERTVHALVPASGELEIHVALRPDPISIERVEIRPPVPTVGLEGDDRRPFPDRGMSMAAVRTHPLLAEADPLSALGGGEVGIGPEMPDGVHVRGGSTDQVAFLLDGIPVFSPYHAAGVFGSWNPDALARIDLIAAAPSAGLPEALSGVVIAETRPIESAVSLRGGLSNTQARATASGPLGGSGAGFLVSLRSGFPGFVAPPREGSYLRAETGDWMGKVEAPVLGGRLRLLGYESENEVDAAAAGSAAGGSEDPARHAFGWRSRSLGAEWSRGSPRSTLHVRGWRAAINSSARWVLPGSIASLGSERRDLGLEMTLERAAESGLLTMGLRVSQTQIDFEVVSSSDPIVPDPAPSQLPATVGFVHVERGLSNRVDVEGGVSVTRAAGAFRFGPRGMLTWRPSDRWSLSGSYAHLHQLVQSARNAESVARTIFPADLWFGAGREGTPVAETQQVVLAAEHQPAAGVRLGTQAFRRVMSGLALVAPVTGSPFSGGAFVPGSGRIRGFSLDLAASSARYSVLAAYGWQDLRLEHATAIYTPEYGSRHSLETGVTIFPSPTLSFRTALVGLFGRRGTPLTGAFEWESCNLLDLGCEFGGSPVHEKESLGGVRLPAYLRLDLGARKHWHVRLAGREMLIGIHGSFTNVLGRRNVLILSGDSGEGNVDTIELRPRAPLVLGMDWQF